MEVARPLLLGVHLVAASQRNRVALGRPNAQPSYLPLGHLPHKGGLGDDAGAEHFRIEPGVGLRKIAEVGGYHLHVSGGIVAVSYTHLDFPPVAPFYWDVYSAEERIKKICDYLWKTINFTESTAEEVEAWGEQIAALQKEFEQFKASGFDDYYKMCIRDRQWTIQTRETARLARWIN